MGAIQGAISAFQSANLVALGERHWAREDSEFRLKLIRDPAFARTVNCIVIEFANPLYQDLLDDYVHGAQVASADLRKIWQNTTQPGAWDSPVYEEFLRGVRAVNAGLPEDRCVRVLAGDQPIDWDQTPQPELRDERDQSAASVIEHEVLNRERRALVLFGSAHLYRSRPGSIVDILKRNPKATWFVIVPIGGPDLPSALSYGTGSPSDPEFVLLGDSAAGHLYANDLLERGTKRVQLVDARPLLVDGRPVLLPVQVFDPHLKVREVADACLVFGTASPELVHPPAGGSSGKNRIIPFR